MEEQTTALRELIQAAFDSLEEQGLMRKTGEFTRGRAGDLQPFYINTTVSKWLNETGLMKDFEEYVELTSQQRGPIN
jgi:hypothetical protein